MRRHVFNVLTGLSLVLALLLAVLWVRSFWWEDLLWWSTYREEAKAGEVPKTVHFRLVEAGSGRGSVAVRHAAGTEDSRSVLARRLKALPTRRELYEKPDYPFGRWLREDAARPWNRIGFYGAAHPSRTNPDLIVAVPYWFLLSLALVVPARRLRAARLRRKERRLRAAVQCFECGYDLRASTGRCPECGMAIPVAADPALRAQSAAAGEQPHSA